MPKVYLLCLCLWLFFSNTAYAENLYLKVEMAVNAFQKTQSASSGNMSMSPGLGSSPSFGVGYKVSDYFEAELMYGQLRYIFENYQMHASFSYFEPVNHELFSEVFPGTRNPPRRPSCSAIPETFLTKKEICGSKPVNHELFSEAFPGTRNPPRRPSCSAIPETFLTKKEICGSTTTNSSISNIYAYGIVQTLIPSIKFVPLKQDYRFVPYFSIGAGIAYSKSRYIDSSYTLSSDAMINNSSRGIKSTRALALEFGAGTKLKLTGNVALDISIKYFCYGKHMMARGVFKKINGYKLSTGVTIAF